MYTHAHVFVYTHIYIYVYIYIHIYIHIFAYKYIYTYIYIKFIYTHIWIALVDTSSIYICKYVYYFYIFLYIDKFLHTCICMYLHIRKGCNNTSHQMHASSHGPTSTHCNPLQPTATHCNTLQHTATHCNTLQHTATHCNTPHRGAHGGHQDQDSNDCDCLDVRFRFAPTAHVRTRDIREWDQNTPNILDNLFRIFSACGKKREDARPHANTTHCQDSVYVAVRGKSKYL